MSKRVLCKFFAHGACLKGDHCDFSHDRKYPTNNVCTFYQKGACSYGSRCRYEHVKVSRSHSSAPSSSAYPRQYLVSDSVHVACLSRTPSVSVTPVPGVTAELSASSRPFFPSTQPARSQISGHHDLLDNGDVGDPRSVNPANHAICSFAASDNCPQGEKCPHIHRELCPTCGKHCLHPFRPLEREEHIKTCEKKQKHLESLKRSQEVECSVCLELVLSKPTAAERKFGLLSECDHPFCVSCIRNWRSSSPTPGMDVNSALRACPICRKLSYFVIPSVIWYSTKEEKQEIIDSYKAKLRSIDCKHFDFGNGTCPFGTSCFYRHTVKPGSLLWNATLRPDTCCPSFLDMDDNDTEYSSDFDFVIMDGLHVMFEHLFRPHTPIGGEEPDSHSSEDSENELSMAEEMAFMLMNPYFYSSDLSSDEDIYFP